MELLIILILIVLNGIFAMSELALVSSRKFKLEAAKKKGNTGAKTALELSENPTKFLSTVQIGITLIGILLGVYSGENLINDVVEILKKYEILLPYSTEIATTIVVIFITYLSIVLGELLPKRIGMTFPEPIISILAKPMRVLSIITSPFVWLLTFSNNFILKILGIKSQTDNKISEEEIKSIVKESAQGGEIQAIEQNIVNRVFELGDRKVDSLFTHRSDVVFFTVTDSWDDVKRKINQEKHSAYPVSKSNTLDDIIGIVLLKDLFSLSDKVFNIEQIIVKPLYFNENISAYKVLEIFKEQKLHYGIVIDEYGTMQGMVTMDDVMDALIGDATESNQNEYEIVQRDEKSWFVDGQYSILEFAKYFSINLTDQQYSNFTTVAGLIINNTNEVPNIGDKVSIDNYIIEVIDKDAQKIDKVLVTRI
ncbi:MAG: hemolysin family protein [Sediminibacterium sp.]|nr:hemolysin family protein [Sediminibacterium sp.]